ncbi:hypothetical protein [Mobiluncus sp.]|uniref:hypothetical protein n=1 Tax=Mobiluncus sp. TaxID=47293 RepID=UPI002A91E269|nr:hypothetical protein [Mobiluncus sp.]MDY6076773.1 hypothetical protein [Mobiluncus sp.]
MMWDVFNAITLAVLVYVVIPFWGAWFFHWLREKREIRKDRERIDQLMADTEAEREQYRTPTNP